MYKHVRTRLKDVRTRLYHYLYVPCTYHVHTCIYAYRNVHTCMYMFMFFNNCIYHVCQPLYTSIVHTLYIHGSDMSVHLYARWSGFQMIVDCSFESCQSWKITTPSICMAYTMYILGICQVYTWYFWYEVLKEKYAFWSFLASTLDYPQSLLWLTSLTCP